MKKILFSVLFFTLCLTGTSLQAQDYQSAVGLRLGSPVSISYKTFLGDSPNALEVFAGTRGERTSSFIGDIGWRWYNVGAAYQIHKPLELGDLEGLSWYWGAGGSAFFWSFDEGFGIGETTTSFAVQGYIGLDYSFANTPISLTLDWVPTILLNGFDSGFGADFGALGVRYIFSR